MTRSRARGDLAGRLAVLWAPRSKLVHLQSDEPGKALCGQWALVRGFRLLDGGLRLELRLCLKCERIAS